MNDDIQSQVANNQGLGPRDALNYLIAAALFIMIGALLNTMLDSNNLSETEMRALIEDNTVDDAELRVIVAEVLRANAQTGAGVNEEVLRAIIQEELDAAGTQGNAPARTETLRFLLTRYPTSRFAQSARIDLGEPAAP